jgi:hypothetical protein
VAFPNPDQSRFGGGGPDARVRPEVGGRATLADRVFRLHAPWPDWLFFPLFALWITINVGLYPAYPAFILRVGTFEGRASSIFPFTWASSFILFVYGLWLFNKRYHLDYVRTAAFALGLSFAATSLFEIIYQNIGIGTGVGNQYVEGQLINLTAIGLAFSSVRFWRASKPLLYSIILFLTGWILWMSVGYPQIFDSNPALAQHAYVFNAALKVGSFIVMGLLVSFAGPESIRRFKSGPEHPDGRQPESKASPGPDFGDVKNGNV